MNQRAVLVFADPISLDLVRRGLPDSLRPLLDFRAVAHRVDADVHLFSSRPASAAFGVRVHPQRGNTFAERLERATDEIARLGYQEIVLVGRDCPSLEASDILRAFAELAANQIVLGPDHRGGCYLIALRADDRRVLEGIRWKRNTDFAQLCARCAAVSILPVKQDVDSWADVQLLARSGHRLAAFVVTLFRVGNCAREFFVDLSAQRVRIRGQMPPPLAAI